MYCSDSQYKVTFQLESRMSINFPLNFRQPTSPLQYDQSIILSLGRGVHLIVKVGGGGSGGVAPKTFLDHACQTLANAGNALLERFRDKF